MPFPNHQAAVDIPYPSDRLPIKEYLNLACRNIPVLNRVINEHGERPLSEYLTDLVFSDFKGYQQRDDVLDVIHRYTSTVLDTTIADTVVEDLYEQPVVLTANHHGVDYFAQSIQGSIIFSLHALAGRNQLKTVPIFSCGNVPLDNLTYPRGALLYNVAKSEIKNMPVRLPVFSDKQKRTIASAAPAIDELMLQRALKRLEKMNSDGKISAKLIPPLKTIIQEDYLDPSVIRLNSYSQQSVVINHRIWKRIFSQTKKIPHLVYLELEKIVGMLLEKDFENSNSLAQFVLFDPLLRERILEELDGASVCWNLNHLKLRSRTAGQDSSKRKELNGSGTIFFWGIDSSGKKIPLTLEKKGGHDFLRGVDDRGEAFELTYTSVSICEALKENRLLPSLFTCFLTLSFARGIVCPGGYFKDEYVPRMHRGVVDALKQTPGYEDVAGAVSRVRPESYLSGMIPVLTRMDMKHLVPCGPVEIIAGGGLTNDDIEKMLSMSIRDAHLAGLFETVPDALSFENRSPYWKVHIAEDIDRLLSKSVVVK